MLPLSRYSEEFYPALVAVSEIGPGPCCRATDMPQAVSVDTAAPGSADPTAKMTMRYRRDRAD